MQAGNNSSDKKKSESSQNQGNESGVEKSESVLSFIRTMNDKTTRIDKNCGRKPVPIGEYVTSRQSKMEELKQLASDYSLSVRERRRYRSQLFALKKRFLEKLKKEKQGKWTSVCAMIWVWSCWREFGPPLDSYFVKSLVSIKFQL